MPHTPPNRRTWFVFPVSDSPTTSLKIVARDDELITQDDAEWIAKLLISARDHGLSDPSPHRGAVGPAQREVDTLCLGLGTDDAEGGM